MDSRDPNNADRLPTEWSPFGGHHTLDDKTRLNKGENFEA